MSKRTELVILLTFCVAMFAACLFVYTQHNSFPYFSHHDEEKKVKQLFTRDFNFNHPHLLLVSTDLVRRIRGQQDGYQRVALSGRWVSAMFAAASVILLTLLGWRAAGLLGAWCVGLLVAVCPILGMTAHFLKEDTAMMFGISASFLALHLWLEKPNANRLIWLGLATGLAFSAKYIGVLCLLAVIPLVLNHAIKVPGQSWFRNLLRLLVPAALVFALINWPLFVQLDSFMGGVYKGARQVALGNEVVDLPNLLVFGQITNLSWPVLLMALLGGFFFITAFRRNYIAAWVLLGTFALFTGTLLLTPLNPVNRYILVPAVCLHAVAGLAIATIAERAAEYRGMQDLRRIRLLAVIAAVVFFLVATPVYRYMALDAFHQADARADLIAWINSNLDDNAVLAASEKIRLPRVAGREPADPSIQFERDPITFKNSVEITPESLGEMRSKGITHVILRTWEWSGYQAMTPSGEKPEIVWHTPEQFRNKNRWLRGDLVVVQL